MNFIPIDEIKYRKHINGKTVYSKRQENSRRQKENSSQLTENSLESSQTEVRKSSQAANDIFGGQAASHETSSENLEPHFQTESQHAGTNQDRHDDGFRDPGEPDEHEDGNQEKTSLRRPSRTSSRNRMRNWRHTTTNT